MDTKTKKLDLIDWMIHLKDESVLNKLYHIKEIFENQTTDLSPAQKKAIDEALNEVLNGDIITHDQVMEETIKRYPYLNKSS